MNKVCGCLLDLKRVKCVEGCAQTVFITFNRINNIVQVKSTFKPVNSTLMYDLINNVKITDYKITHVGSSNVSASIIKFIYYLLNLAIYDWGWLFESGLA